MLHSFYTNSIHSRVKVFTIFVRKIWQNKYDDACYGSYTNTTHDTFQQNSLKDAIYNKYTFLYRSIKDIHLDLIKKI